MASEKQVMANRANAKRSTGPKTKTGKSLSCINAYKHGLTAQTIVIHGEDPEEFNLLRAKLEDEFKPRPGMESELVERLAACMWRMRRIPVFEASLIEARRAEIAQTEPTLPPELTEAHEEVMKKVFAPYVAELPPRPPNPELEAAERKYEAKKVEVREKLKEESQGAITGLALILDSQKYQDTLGKLSRYEAALMNAFNRTLQQLLSLQDRRARESDRDQVVDVLPSETSRSDAA